MSGVAAAASARLARLPLPSYRPPVPAQVRSADDTYLFTLRRFLGSTAGQA